MFAEILGAIKTIGAIINGIKDLIAFVNEARNEAWWDSWKHTMIDLRNAKTPEERKNAAAKIADGLSKL